MALTLAEAANQQRVTPEVGATIMLLDEYSPILKDCPFTTIDGRFYEFQRAGTLGSVGWRGINQSPSESVGQIDVFREYLKILSAEAQIDNHLLRTQPKGAADLMATQVKFKVQLASNELSRVFLEGSEVEDVKEPVGVQARCAGTQLITCAGGGGTLTLAKLNELVDAVPFATNQEEGMRPGQGLRKVLYMNRTLRRKIEALLEAQTGSLRVQVTKDTFGKYVEMWRDAVIRVVEFTGTGTTTLGFDEDPGDGTPDCASIYCMAYGENLAHGFRPAGSSGDIFSIEKYMNLQASPASKIRIEGDLGFAFDHPRCAARLHAITNT
jgi:hypothetical protein